MKIGLAVGYFDPQVGGSEEVVKRLSAGLAARGHDVEVATSVNPDRDPSRMVVPVREFAVSGNTVGGISGDLLGYQKHLRESDRDVWLFYAAQIWSTDLALPLLGSMSAATVIVPCGYSGMQIPAFAPYLDALPAFLTEADALVYMSRNYQDFERDQALGLGHLARVIPNAASDEEFEDAASGRPSRKGRLVITVANFLEDKGHDAVIDAFRKEASPDDRLVLVGNRFGPIRQSKTWAKCKLASLRDRRIRLAEHLPREEVVRLYKEADIFLFGSRVECAPLVLIEAMASGLPFVTTPAGNARDYEDAGLVVPEPELAPALGRLLADADLRTSLGARGRERWDHGQRWSTVVDQYEQLMTELVESRSAAGARPR